MPDWAASSMINVATNRKPESERYPLDQALAEEVATIFKDDPEFKEGLRQTAKRVRGGEETLVPNADVRRRLKRMGLPLDDDVEA